jgi:hypothetical protein
MAVGSRGQGFDSNYVSGRHSVLLSTGADNRVHTPASVKISLSQKDHPTQPARTPAQPCGSDELPAELLMLAVFSATALQQPGQASPERVGEYSQTQPF